MRVDGKSIAKTAIAPIVRIRDLKKFMISFAPVFIKYDLRLTPEGELRQRVFTRCLRVVTRIGDSERENTCDRHVITRFRGARIHFTLITVSTC